MTEADQAVTENPGTVTEIETSAFYGDRAFRINLCEGTAVTFQLRPDAGHVEIYTSPSYGQGELSVGEVTEVIARLATLAGWASGQRAERSTGSAA